MTETILEKRVLKEVADLNRAFFDLLPLMAGAIETGPLLGLDRELARRIVALPGARRTEMAQCGYTLFSLRLDDFGYWRPASEGRIPHAYRNAGGIEDPDAAATLSRFCLTALLFARHLASSDGFSATLTLGLPGRGCAIDTVPLVLMQQLASINKGLLRARFAAHARFWPDLVWSAEHGTRIQRLASRMLGVHLLTGRVADAASQPFSQDR